MDQSSKELHADVAEPIPMRPASDDDTGKHHAGTPRRQDDKYERNGTRAIFMFVAPQLGWRRATCREYRTRLDWAHEVKRLLDEDFPLAKRITLVCDNLNTHGIASLYAAFPAEEAHRLANRLNIVHTPRNGSWLNIAEIELSVLANQCLNRRIPNQPTLEDELKAWNINRNQQASKVNWQFTTADTRVKLRHLYPRF
jgi:DDE superfamily endonuclease